MHFTVVRPSVGNEAAFLSGTPLRRGLLELALAKAESVSRTRPDALVLGADTVVVIGGSVLGKPRNRRDAAAALRRLSGKMHTVFTAVALVCRACGFSKCAVAATRVRFRNLAKWEIDRYLARGEHEDKAGAYAIQGRAMAFVDSITGCYYNVVGLPVAETIHLFQAYAEGKGAENA